MIATIVSVLALAGAPANTPVICQPNGLPNGDLGQTYRSDHHIELDRYVCGGMLLLVVDPQMRRRIIRLNPLFEAAKWMGIGALVAIHEAHHAAGIFDETDTECAAYAQVNQFLDTYLDGLELSIAESWAQWYDSQLPSAYHAHPCPL